LGKFADNFTFSRTLKAYPLFLLLAGFVSQAWAEAPSATLPEGYTLEVAAAAPLVRHPIMGCIDDRGHLYIGDAAGLNLKKDELEKQLPNRVLQLTDTKGDGHYDKVTVFADNMTFPQGGCWLNGSLYVASPPGIWKLTDTDGDGVADQREMIVSGFDYTGNAADIHGPFLNPTNGRLYWCHGRKGHRVVQKDGTVVHEGLASGIWSCNPDGSDIQWHALSSADNPVEIVFTPDGDIIGAINLFYSQPRGDVLLHWLYGGVYPRPDQLQAIAGLPRTVDLPVIHNFGHVAVSGLCLLQSGALNPAWKGQIFITHFNTQRVARMELIPDGATYRTREHEFFKLNSPDAHLTDVLEDRDGSLLVLDTGGWFRIGCPSSLTAKPEIMGAVYRIKRPGQTKAEAPTPIAKSTLRSEEELIAALASSAPKAQLAACDEIALRRLHGDKVEKALLTLLGQPLEPALEHGAMFAALRNELPLLSRLRETGNPLLARRLLLLSDQASGGAVDSREIVKLATAYLTSSDPDLVTAAVKVVARQPDSAKLLRDDFAKWLQEVKPDAAHLRVFEAVVGPQLANAAAQETLGQMLANSSVGVRRVAWQAVAQQSGNANKPAWLPLLQSQLESAAPGDLPTLLAAVKKLRSPQFREALEKLAKDDKQPLTNRLRALDAMAGSQKLEPASFTLLLKTLNDPAAPTSAQIQAATMLGAAALTRDQQMELAPQFATLGPIQLREAIHAINKTKDVEVGKGFAQALVNSPVLASVQESTLRTLFQSYPPEIFEQTLLPALHRADAAVEAQRRRLGPLSEKVIAQGKPEVGQKLFESGRGSCIACHQVGAVGRSIGPNLSHIGAIRREIDILESIIFPSATLARDYEAHSIESAGGETLIGIIKSHTAEGILLVDIGGQEHNIRHDQITADTQLPTSLMPVGLDQTLSESELVDLVAFLRSRK